MGLLEDLQVTASSFCLAPTWWMISLVLHGISMICLIVNGLKLLHPQKFLDRVSTALLLQTLQTGQKAQTYHNPISDFCF